ncbi:hypothetical protein ACHAP5_012201 [Fusarium lateritium]
MAQSTSAESESQERHGLFVLHPGPDELYDASDYLVDIVAIHGLGGHPFKTWREKEGRHLWLRDSLPTHIPQSRIMSFGYDSTVLFGKSRSQIYDYAVDLANRLEIFRQNSKERYRPLIFICHSLGGVVFKEFLVQVALTEAPELHLMDVVEPFLAILGLPNERAVPVNTNHRGLAHVSPKKPHQYLPIWSSIKQLAEGCLTSIEADNRALLDALFCLDPKAAQMRPRQSQNGTCEWIFSHSKYTEWLECTESPILLLTGRPGSGKSVLTRCVAENIQSYGLDRDSESGYLVVSHFCSYMDTALNSEDTVLRTLLHQLVQLNPRCGMLVRNRVETRTKDGIVLNLSTKKMWKALEQILSMQTMKRVIIVIDAIEELGTDVATAVLVGLWEIADYLSEQNIHPRVFISSRSSTSLTDGGLTGLEILNLGDVDMRIDIEKYLTSSIDEFRTDNESFNVSVTPLLQKQIVSRISDAAAGMFLVAVLAWEDFQRGLLWNQNTVAQKLDEVLSVGSSMTTYYDRLIERIADSADSLGHLSVKNAYQQSQDIEPFENLNTVMEREVPHLVSLQDDGTITFAHLSFKDYIESQERFSNIIEMGRQSITKACLIYLKLQDLLESGAVETEYDELAAQYPFLAYASNHFLWHINGFPPQDPIWLLFSDTAGERSIYSLNSLWPENKYYGTTPLRYVLGYLPEPSALSLARSFQEYGYDMDEKWSSTCGRALQYCCMNAKNDFGKKAALLLLELGANPSLPENPFRSNLRLAIMAEAWELYDAILCHPLTDLSARNEQGGTLLHDQVKCGPVERIAEMLDLINEVDLNAQDRDGYTPLHLATSLGREDMDAADAGFKECLLLLLESGRADPSQRDIEGRNLAHWASTLDCVDAMELISKMPGAKLDQRDRHGKTPIDIAFICKSKNVGLFLADKVPFTNIYYWDLMYDTPHIEYEAEDDQVETCYEVDLLERNARRQKLANEEYEQLRMQYPPHLWALIPHIHKEPETKKEDTEKKKSEKSEKEKTPKERSSKEKASKGKTSKDKAIKKKASEKKPSKSGKK